MFRVKPTAETSALLKLLTDKGEVRKRVAALERTVAVKTAAALLEDVKAKAPKSPELKPYVKALEVVDIAGHQNTAAVTSEMKRDLATVDTSTTLALFPQTPGQAVLPILAILRQYEPWAVDMLPPVTVKDVVLRQVNTVEVDKARAANVMIQSAARTLLKQSGAKLGTAFVVSGTAMLDLANLVLRIEFGAPGVPQEVHWRPGVKKAIRGVFTKKLARDPKLKLWVTKTLFDLGFGSYGQEAPPADRSITSAEAEQYTDFQKRLA